jgi:hypothetical protein
MSQWAREARADGAESRGVDAQRHMDGAVVQRPIWRQGAVRFDRGDGLLPMSCTSSTS